MRKKVLISIGSIFVIMLGIGLYLWFNKDDNTQVYENKKEEAKAQISGFNGISMMYETGPGTGEYSESKSSLWPDSGYIFNENLSGCENEGELSWNSETNTVNLLSNSSDACYVYFDAYIIPVINSVTTSNIETDSITLTVNATNGNNPITTYYYSNNNGSSYVSSNSNTYTFSGLDMGTVYNFSVYVEDSAGYESEVYTLNETTEDTPPTLAEVCSNTDTLSNCIVKYYNATDSDISNIYYHNSDLANGANDNSYRFFGDEYDNPNNYVCFGSSLSECPYDNLYRIIGVFGTEVKLIKADFASSNLLGTNGDYSEEENDPYGNYIGKLDNWGRYFWSGSAWDDTDWRNSRLNTINLNTNFLNNIGSTWSNKIAYHNWIIGGNTSSNIEEVPPVNAYQNEIINPATNLTYNAKVGLIYVSDVGYASSENYYWATENMGDYGAVFTENWLMLGETEWTITRITDSTSQVYAIWNTGDIWSRGACNTCHNDACTITSPGEEWAVRPVFYLNSNITYVSGSGTSSDPIRIN